MHIFSPFLDFSCSALHTMILDANSTVWNFISWGRPFRLVSPLLDCSSPETTPIQIECRLPLSAVLSGSGDVYAWWPYGDAFKSRYQRAMAELDKDESTKAIVPDGGTVIPCYTWEINMDPVKLPALPNLRDLPATGLPGDECRKETKLIKIAGFQNSLVGLTNKGHVLKMDKLYTEDSARIWHYVSKSVRMIWHPSLNSDTQLPNYSEIAKVKKHPTFHATVGNDGQERPSQVELLSDTMLITHVSYIAVMSPGFHVENISTFSFRGTANASSPIHPPWSSWEKSRQPQRRSQSSSQNFRTDPSSLLSAAMATLVLSLPPENS